MGDGRVRSQHSAGVCCITDKVILQVHGFGFCCILHCRQIVGIFFSIGKYGWRSRHSCWCLLNHSLTDSLVVAGLTAYYPSEDGVWLPTWWGNWKWSRTQSSHPMQCNCTCTCTGVGAHTRWPSECSDEERYNNNCLLKVWFTDLTSFTVI